MVNDNHDTGTATVSNDANLTVNRQRTLPFGANRGPNPTAWVGDKGFVGGTKDNTGLTHLGAREYDPLLGKFISVDPIMDTGSPASWNGYAYAGNNPVGATDASGLSCIMDDGSQCAPAKPKSSGGGTVKPSTPTSGDSHPVGQPYIQQGGTGEELCISGYSHCFAGYAISNWGAYVDAYYAELNRLKVLDNGGDLAAVQYAMALIAGCGAGSDDNCESQTYQEFNQLVGQAIVDDREHRHPSGWKNDTELGIAVAATTAANMAMGLPSCMLRGGSRRNSFGADTPVLLANGKTKKMKNIRAGDEVMATDPETGEQGPRRVAHVWVHNDDLYTLTVNGKNLTTTEDHPFWNATDSAWEPTQKLDVGDLLRTPTGSLARVDGFTETPHRYAAAYNLTVDDLHSYYVLAGSTPVLVHNDNGFPGTLWTGGSFPVGGSVDAGGPANGVLYRTQNGVVSNYAVYGPGGTIQYRVDLVGASHGGVDTPHYQPYEVNTNPKTGARYPKPTGEAFSGYGPNGAPRLGGC
ncbi:MAG: hypothetical protein QOH97_3059 [Actinoplanes sp.]|nr:hypothetical protein [Actinoplanes sp.]